MRIACYGLAEEHAGSVASANYVLLQKLLALGVQVDFFAKADFVQKDHLFTHPNFFYDGTLLETAVDVQGRLSVFQNGVAGRFADEAIYRLHLRVIEGRVARWHSIKPYDALLFLGLEPQFDAPPGVPVVTWVQGPPQTEWEAISRVQGIVTRTSGRWLYEKLRLFYAFKRLTVLRALRSADEIICGSRWSRRHIISEGLPASQVHALPYPVDFDVFHPLQDETPLYPERKTLLWLGRIDPRKRLDLMLDGFEQLLRLRQDVHLHIVGWFSYAPELQQLLANFPFPEHITYEDRRPREDMPLLLNRADVLVQPSESENFGSAVAEALSCGTPVVIGPTNGTGEYCQMAAYRFDHYTPAALAEAIQQALEDSAAPDQIKDEAVSIARTAFAPDRVADQLMQVLQKAVEEEKQALEGSMQPIVPRAA
jgi:glycosyltransferase involved in cell wall biosynthesis